MNTLSTYKIQARNGFWKIDRTLAKFFQCIHTVMILDELIFHETKHADSDGWFYYQAEQLEDVCMIGEKLRKKCLDKLSECGILEIQRRGQPFRNWYRINDEAIDRVIRSVPKSLSTNVDANDPPREGINDLPEEGNDALPREGNIYNNNISIKKGSNNNILYSLSDHPDPVPKASTNDLTSRIWLAYRTEYISRYKTPPARNVRVNSQILQLSKLLGEDAIEVIKFYVWHNDSWYIKHSHTIGHLVANAESLYVQWKRGRAITNRDIKSFENVAALTELDKAIFEGDI